MKLSFSRTSRPPRDPHRSKRGVALIIVLGFLGLMVMMAVAFMIQARVERIVADSTLESMRARQVAQTGIAAAIQDYMNYIKELGNDLPRAMTNMFLSGDLKVTDSYHYADGTSAYYDSTNLWNGEASDWLPPSILDSDSIDIEDVADMRWILVRQKPNTRSRILGRYAYACLNLSGNVDANLLGTQFGENIPGNGYGAQTNRNNVRKMLLNGVRASPSAGDSEIQRKLARYQAMWQGFDTPAALNLLTDGKFNDGDDSHSVAQNRWAKYVGSENDIGPLSKDYLSCYSYAATHKGSKMKFTEKNDISKVVRSDDFRDMVSRMGGNQKHIQEIEKALNDYFSDPSDPTYPLGTDYPSVAAVPMFNEIMAEVTIKKSDAGEWQLKVTIKPEFWYPFPSEDNDDGATYQVMAPSMGGGATETGNADIWIRFVAGTSAGALPSLTLEQVEVSPASQNISKNDTSTPHAYDPPFVYTMNIKGLEKDSDGNYPDITRIMIRSIAFNNPWFITRSGHNVDATPSGSGNILSFGIRPPILVPGGPNATGKGGMECDDPRLNHDKNLWSASDEGTINAKNSSLDKAKKRGADEMGYDPGDYMYCRNGAMETPAELGYIPIFVQEPWVTLDIFSDKGVTLLNSLVCDSDVWDKLEEYDAYYTNGTINPYTRDLAVFNGAFFGLDGREVPNMKGKPNQNEVIGGPRARELATLAIRDKAPGSDTFDKHGPAGWSRILRANERALPGLNKNQRVFLAHNTWGLFNESDTLFLVFVVAQSITEAPEKVDPVGNFDPADDTITGERWAVALCWMDTSAEGNDNDLTQEMDIIMFKYLNE